MKVVVEVDWFGAQHIRDVRYALGALDTADAKPGTSHRLEVD